MKVLMVLTSHDRLGDTGRKTGFWLEELAAPYYVFRDAGVDIALASPKGGRPPLDPKSNEPSFQTDVTRRFENDAEANARLDRTVRLDAVKQEGYDTVFLPWRVWAHAGSRRGRDLCADRGVKPAGVARGRRLTNCARRSADTWSKEA